MANEKIDWKGLLTKAPFKRMVPQSGYGGPARLFRDDQDIPYDPGTCWYKLMTQADFLAEYEPTAHAINDPNVYPDIWRIVSEPATTPDGAEIIDPLTGEVQMVDNCYCEQVPRCAFPYQQIITWAHIYHLTGNDLQIELSGTDHDESDDELFDNMVSDWQSSGREEDVYESIKAREKVADVAFVAALDEKGNLRAKVLSYEKGDILYPHYDEWGELKYFARLTKQYDYDNHQTQETVELWTDSEIVTYVREVGSSVVLRIGRFLGLEGWKEVSRKSHGFDFVPVAYMRRDEGPGWSGSQDLIENYELSFSQMAHNNQAFGEPILVLKSKAEMPPNISRGLNGTAKSISMDVEDKAEYLEGQSASESYIKQLETLEDMIYRGSSIVKSPTELKSGDTPATAIKLLFTPNMSYCESEAKEIAPYLRKMWKIHAFAYGRKNNCLVKACSIKANVWIKVYIPISESAIVSDLVALTGAGILSKMTAGERAPFYAKSCEWKRVQKEQKEKQDAELLYEQKTIEANKKAEMEKSAAAAKNVQRNNMNRNGGTKETDSE